MAIFCYSPSRRLQNTNKINNKKEEFNSLKKSWNDALLNWDIQKSN